MFYAERYATISFENLLVRCLGLIGPLPVKDKIREENSGKSKEAYYDDSAQRT
tara:strand:- start:260 stop:418 length:159 start_codon:yes stop_codon:yes gene_type:complete